MISLHGKRRGARENLRERAFVLRIEMLHQHEPHARVERQVLEQLRECFEPAGGGADADNHHAIPAIFRPVRFVLLDR